MDNDITIIAVSKWLGKAIISVFLVTVINRANRATKDDNLHSALEPPHTNRDIIWATTSIGPVDYYHNILKLSVCKHVHFL